MYKCYPRLVGQNLLQALGRKLGWYPHVVVIEDIMAGDLPWQGDGDFYVHISTDLSPPACTSSVATNPQVVNWGEKLSLRLRNHPWEEKVHVEIRDLNIAGHNILATVEFRAQDLVQWAHGYDEATWQALRHESDLSDQSKEWLPKGVQETMGTSKTGADPEARATYGLVRVALNIGPDGTEQGAVPWLAFRLREAESVDNGQVYRVTLPTFSQSTSTPTPRQGGGCCQPLCKQVDEWFFNNIQEPEQELPGGGHAVPEWMEMDITEFKKSAPLLDRFGKKMNDDDAKIDPKTRDRARFAINLVTRGCTLLFVLLLMSLTGYVGYLKRCQHQYQYLSMCLERIDVKYGPADYNPANDCLLLTDIAKKEFGLEEGRRLLGGLSTLNARRLLPPANQTKKEAQAEVSQVCDDKSLYVSQCDEVGDCANPLIIQRPRIFETFVRKSGFPSFRCVADTCHGVRMFQKLDGYLPWITLALVVAFFIIYVVMRSFASLVTKMAVWLFDESCGSWSPLRMFDYCTELVPGANPFWFKGARRRTAHPPKYSPALFEETRPLNTQPAPER